MILRRTFMIFTSVLLIPPTLWGWGWLTFFGQAEVAPEVRSAVAPQELALYNTVIPGLITVAVLIAAVMAVLAQVRGWRKARIAAKVVLLVALTAFLPYAGYLTLIYWWRD